MIGRAVCCGASRTVYCARDQAPAGLASLDVQCYASSSLHPLQSTGRHMAAWPTERGADGTVRQKPLQRLAFGLRSLLPPAESPEGYRVIMWVIISIYHALDGRLVFLGFSRCGLFVFSYRHVVEASQLTGSQAGAYTLELWRFSPCGALTLVLYSMRNLLIIQIMFVLSIAAQRNCTVWRHAARVRCAHHCSSEQ